jgi:hypothetical protein
MAELFNRYIAATGTQNTATQGAGSRVDASKPQEKKPEAKVDTPNTVPVVPVPGELVGEPGVKLGDLEYQQQEGFAYCWKNLCFQRKARRL